MDPDVLLIMKTADKEVVAALPCAGDEEGREENEK